MTSYNICLYILFSSLVLSSGLSSASSKPTEKCIRYNKASCRNISKDCGQIQHCEGHENVCFVTWRINRFGELILLKKGCYPNHIDCSNGFECVDQSSKGNNGIHFCCCKGDLCNKNFTWTPPPFTPTSMKSVDTPPNYPYPSPETYLIITGVIFLVAVLLLIAYLLFGYFSSKKKYLKSESLQFIEKQYIGRFGEVWRSLYESKTVAAKKILYPNKGAWLTEIDFYTIHDVGHPNILDYVGALKMKSSLSNEYIIVTAFHEKGTLCDYLKQNVVTWEELSKITESIIRGLIFLHCEQRDPEGRPLKPPMAHRNISSQNVLLKADMSACIGDFGLVSFFYNEYPHVYTQVQVGYLCYMAPEVLGISVNFVKDDYLRSDVYSFALVLWELVNRCKINDEPVPPYKAPFEDELGPSPTFKDVKDYVLEERKRPVLQKSWEEDPGLSIMCGIMKDSWHHEPVIRLTAECILARLPVLYYPETKTHQAESFV